MISTPEAGHEPGTVLQRVIAEIPTKGDFPAVARVIDDLRTMAGREHCAALDIARIVLRDPGFSSKLLRLVNSAFYRRQGEPVSTVTRAVMMVGFEAIRDLASVILVVEDLLRAGKANVYVRDGLRSALYRGLLSQRLSAHVGYAKPEEAYLLGLFGDLGTLWLATHYPSDFARAYTRAAARAFPIDAGVREVFGGETATLSAAILEAWGFPPTFAAHFHGRTIRHRDDLKTAGARLSAVVQIANEWTRAMETGHDIDPAIFARAESLFGISADQLVILAREAHESLREHVTALGLGRVGEFAGFPGAEATNVGATQPAPAQDPPAARPRLDESSALQAVADITRSIIERREINDIMLMVLESLVRVGEFDAAFLALVTVQRDRLVGRLACGVGAEAHLGELNAPLVGGASLFADVVLDRRAQVVRPGEPHSASGMLASAALMAVPLIVREQCVGVVVATRTPADEITPADQSLVELLCNQAAVALHHVSG